MPLDADPSVATTTATRRRFRPRLSLGMMMAVVALAAVGLTRLRPVSKVEALAIVEAAVLSDSKEWGPLHFTLARKSPHMTIAFVPRSPGSSRGVWVVTPYHDQCDLAYGPPTYTVGVRRPLFGRPRVRFQDHPTF